MRRRTIAALGAVAAAVGLTHAASGNSNPPSRLDDGGQYLPEAGITEQQAIAAAQARTTGALNEVDLEHRKGKLVYNVDVGASDVKVDAATGDVVAVDRDD